MAAELARLHRPSLVILGPKLWLVSREEACSRFRSEPETSSAGIIMLGQSGEEHERVIARDKDDFHRAHEESFLFHLHGARDGFLHEVNEHHGLGIPADEVTLKRLRKELKETGKKNRQVSEIRDSEKNQLSIEGVAGRVDPSWRSAPHLFVCWRLRTGKPGAKGSQGRNALTKHRR
jgi:hypothetical protein